MSVFPITDLPIRRGGRTTSDGRPDWGHALHLNILNGMEDQEGRPLILWAGSDYTQGNSDLAGGKDGHKRLIRGYINRDGYDETNAIARTPFDGENGFRFTEEVLQIDTVGGIFNIDIETANPDGSFPDISDFVTIETATEYRLLFTIKDHPVQYLGNNVNRCGMMRLDKTTFNFLGEQEVMAPDGSPQSTHLFGMLEHDGKHWTMAGSGGTGKGNTKRLRSSSDEGATWTDHGVALDLSDDDASPHYYAFPGGRLMKRGDYAFFLAPASRLYTDAPECIEVYYTPLATLGDVSGTRWQYAGILIQKGPIDFGVWNAGFVQVEGKTYLLANVWGYGHAGLDEYAGTNHAAATRDTFYYRADNDVDGTFKSIVAYEVANLDLFDDPTFRIMPTDSVFQIEFDGEFLAHVDATPAAGGRVTMLDDPSDARTLWKAQEYEGYRRIMPVANDALHLCVDATAAAIAAAASANADTQPAPYGEGMNLHLDTWDTGDEKNNLFGHWHIGWAAGDKSRIFLQNRQVGWWLDNGLGLSRFFGNVTHWFAMNAVHSTMETTATTPEPAQPAYAPFIAARHGYLFNSRADWLAWAATATPNVGDRALWGDLVVEYDGTTNTFSEAAVNGWKPVGEIHVAHYKDNVTPGVTDMTAAVQAAVDFAHTLTDVDEGYGYCVPIDLGNQKHALSSDGTYSVDMRGRNRIKFQNGEFLAIGTNWGTAVWDNATKTWSGIVPLFTLTDDAGGDRARFIRFENILIDCAHKSAGALYDNADKCGMQDVTCIHFVGYGMQSVTKNGEFRGTRVTMAQYLYGETGWDDQNNRTADGFVMNTADHQMTDCVGKYCRYPLMRGNGTNGQWINFHPYLGGATTVTGDQIGIYLHDGPGTTFVNTYLDKCSVFINANNVEKVSFISGQMSRDQNDAYFIIEADTAGTDLAGLTIRDMTGTVITNGVRFDTTGPGSFASNLEWHVDNMRNPTGGVLNGFPRINRPDDYNMDGGARTYRNAQTIDFEQFVADFTTFNFNRGLVFNLDPDNTANAARSGFLVTTDGGKALFELTPSGVIIHKNKKYTVATLPTSPVSAQTAFVTDATATTMRSVVAGGGSNLVQVMYDGSDWIIIG